MLTSKIQTLKLYYRISQFTSSFQKINIEYVKFSEHTSDESVAFAKLLGVKTVRRWQSSDIDDAQRYGPSAMIDNFFLPLNSS